MRILIFSQYFAPEVTAARARLEPFAELLAAAGHKVEVICEVPNHPEGIVREGYRGRFSVRRQADGYRVKHVWVRASPVKSTRSRVLFYGTYALSAMIAGALGRRPDVIFISSPPLPAAAAAMAVAWRHRVPWVMDVRDPWPEAAVALGELTNPRVIAALERLERKLYADAAAIVTVTETFKQGIAAKVGDPGKVTIIPNGTTRAWMEAGETEPDRGELDMPEDRFVLTYAGNVGLAQGLEFAIEAAGELGEGFQLQIVGSGPLLERAKAAASKLPPGRVVFRGLVEPELAATYLRASDATLVPLNAGREFEQFIPSKLFDCCAVGRPVILAAGGESRRLAERYGAALAIESQDSRQLVEAVRKLQTDEALRADLGRRGRDCAAEYLRERQAERLGELLEAVVSDRGRGRA